MDHFTATGSQGNKVQEDNIAMCVLKSDNKFLFWSTKDPLGFAQNTKISESLWAVLNPWKNSAYPEQINAQVVHHRSQVDRNTDRLAPGSSIFPPC